MIESLDDYERLAALKSWSKKYGIVTVVFGAAILAATLGWQYRHYYQNQQAEQASMIYAQLEQGGPDNNTINVTTAANSLMLNYAATPYAKLAALMLARRAVQNQNLDLAKTQLTWVIEHPQQAMLSQLAQLRLARILIAQQQPQLALDSLAGAEQIYPIETRIVRAIALVDLGDNAAARKILGQAIGKLTPRAPLAPILTLYLNDI